MPEPTDSPALTPMLLALAARAGERLRVRRETVAVCEGAAGGLISAALLSVPGASSYFVGGGVIYTLAASRAFLAGAVPAPPGLRGASEPWALHLARSAVAVLGADWGIGEGGAAGPTGNRYGDPAGHAWVAVSGGHEATRRVLTGDGDRVRNMAAFAEAALALLLETLEAESRAGAASPS
jgi:nicotinamide-nucleotide amidase